MVDAKLHAYWKTILITDLFVGGKKIIVAFHAIRHRRSSERTVDLPHARIVAIEYQLATRLEVFGKCALFAHDVFG